MIETYGVGNTVDEADQKVAEQIESPFSRSDVLTMLMTLRANWSAADHCTCLEINLLLWEAYECGQLKFAQNLGPGLAPTLVGSRAIKLHPLAQASQLSEKQLTQLLRQLDNEH